MTRDELTQTKEIRDSLEPLFDKAEKQRLWFYSSYQSLWFYPEELRQEQSVGHFIWGAANWELRNPNENLEYLQWQADRANKELQDFIYRMAVNQVDG